MFVTRYLDIFTNFVSLCARACGVLAADGWMVSAPGASVLCLHSG